MPASTKAQKIAERIEARKRLEARFVPGRSYCMTCGREVDPWTDTHEGYTHCCNDRAADGAECRTLSWDVVDD